LVEAFAVSNKQLKTPIANVSTVQNFITNTDLDNSYGYNFEIPISPPDLSMIADAFQVGGQSLTNDE
jgi:hypothetical protein